MIRSMRVFLLLSWLRIEWWWRCATAQNCRMLCCWRRVYRGRSSHQCIWTRGCQLPSHDYGKRQIKGRPVRQRRFFTRSMWRTMCT